MECRRIESRHELHNAGAWEARDIVPMNGPVSLEAVEAALQRIGGTRLVLQIDTTALHKNLVEQARDDVRRVLREGKIGLAAAPFIRGNAVETRFKDTASVSQALRALEQLTSGPFPQLELQRAGDDAQLLLSVNVTKHALAEQLDSTEQAKIEYLSRRAQELSLETSLIQPLDAGRILAIVPGLEDPEQLLRVLHSRSRLDFSIADGAFDPCIGTPVPPESEVVTDETGKASLLVRRQLIATGQDIVFAAVVLDSQTRAPAVVIRFTTRASHQFHTATRDNNNNGRLFAFLVDRQVAIAATIREPIDGREIRISGGFTLQQAKDFAMQARTGGLLAPLTIIEREVVEPAPIAPR